MDRFFLKSIEQGAFFRDVRMTPAHFDELVALETPYLPVGTRGPAAIPSRWRFFAVLFWLAQGGRQRVVARAVDVAESTFCKFCTPVVEALRHALPAPAWPDKHERKKIGLDFSRLTGGNHAAWRGLYVPYVMRFCFSVAECARPSCRDVCMCVHSYTLTCVV